MKTKTCTKCGIEKSLSKFHKSSGHRFNVCPACKICVNAQKKKDYVEDKRKYDAYREAYRKIHREKAKKYAKDYHKKNKDKIKKGMVVYYQTHKAERALKLKQRRKTDPRVRLNDNMSGAIRKALNRNKNGWHWETLVGYTLNKLKKHLEKLFTEGMSWNNYGINGWHIDHKIPLSVFNFTKPEHVDFLRCWALENLRPMWAKENLEKHNKIDRPFQPSLLF